MERRRIAAIILLIILAASSVAPVRAEEMETETDSSSLPADAGIFASDDGAWDIPCDEEGNAYHFTGEYARIDGEYRPIYESELSEAVSYMELFGNYYVGSVGSRVGSPEQSAENYYYLMYNQLSESSKQVYDALKENYSVWQDKDAKVEVIVDEKIETDERLEEVGYYAIAALNMDEQKMFWLNVNAISFQKADRSDGTTRIIFGLNEDYFDSMISPCYSDWAAVQTDMSEMETRREQIMNMIPDDAGFYKKIEIINDYLIDYNYYNRYIYYGASLSEENSGKLRKAYISASALTEQTWLKSSTDKGDPASPVCEGYARAFKLVCDELGIPCILVCGRMEGSDAGHMWNYVQNKDTGIWYAVDSTWNDPVRANEWSEPVTPEDYRHAYLLVGSQTPDPYDPEKTFLEKHPANGAVWTGGKPFEVPTLAETVFEESTEEKPDPGKEPEEEEHESWGDVDILSPEELASLGFSKPSDIPKDLWVSGVHDTAYTGNAVTFPDLKVFNHNKLLSSKDYSIKYSQNTEVGEAKLIITGKGDFKDSKEHIFKIEPIDLSSGSAAVKAPDVVTYENGEVQKLTTPVSCIVNDQWVDLQEGRDFEFIYEMGNSAGTGSGGSFSAPGVYMVTVQGKAPNFKGFFQFKETILESRQDAAAAKSVQELKISVSDITINGKTDLKTVLPDVTVEDDAGMLEQGKHYSVELSRPVKVGMVNVYITGIAESGYVGTAVLSCTVNGTPVNNSMIEGMESSYPYEAMYVTVHDKPGFRIYDEKADYTLQPGVDYEVSYKNNGKKGTASMTCRGIGAYTGTLKRTFKIQSCNIAGTARITVESIPPAAYQKGGARPLVTVKDGTKVLKNGVDYKLAYTGNTSVGTDNGATVKITGKGNYKGTVFQSFTVVNSSIQNVNVSVSDIVYSGKAKAPTVTVKDTNGKKLIAGKDYEKSVIFKYKDGRAFDHKNDALQAGDVLCAVVTGKGFYAGGGAQPATKEVEFRCVNADISKATVKVADQAYTGTTIRPTKQDVLAVYIGKGAGRQTLSATDYEIVPEGYGSNTARGKGTMVVRGLGNYGGTKKVTFNIKSRSVSTIAFLGRLLDMFNGY